MARKPEETGRKKGRLLRLPFQLIGALTLALILLALAAKFWLVPAVLRARLISLLTGVWQGPVHIEHIQVNYSAPFHIKGLTLSDNRGRPWLRIPTARLIQTNWPSFKPVITGIDIDQFKVQIFFPDGESELPLKLATPRKGPPKRASVDLRELSVRDISITIADARGQTATLDNLTFTAIRSGSSYNLSLTQTVPKPTEVFRLRGSAHAASWDINLWLDIDHTLAAPETAMLFAALNVPLPVTAAGRLQGNLAVTGSLKDPNTLQTKGLLNLDDWAVEARDNIVATDVASVAKLDGKRFDFHNITALAYGGHIDGSFHVILNPGQKPTLGGQFQAQQIDFEQLTSALLGPQKKAKGTLMLMYSFTEQTGDLRNLQGSGHLLLNDAQLYVLSLTADIFRALGLQDLTASRRSDVHAAFRTTGPEVTLESAHLANRLLAIKAEPGGSINLESGNLNLYLIGVPFKQIDTLARQLPVVRLFVNLKDKLVRLRVKGHWKDPRDKLITKQPIQDVGQGTLGFFADVIKEGGHLGRAALKKFGIRFESPDAQSED
jgi:hypothetical protein